MTVYIVEKGVAYEGSWVHGVYAKEADAKAVVDANKDDNTYDWSYYPMDVIE